LGVVHVSTTEHNGFLLGSVRLVRASQTLKLNSRKALGLLGYLAQQGRPIERDWLIELLWSEDDAPGAKGSMRTLLKNLRKQLGEAFYADRQVVALEPDAITWDIDRFSHLAAQDDIAAWVQASALYQGEFMRGFQLDASVEFEDWLETTRHFWFDAVNRVLRNISDYYLHHDQAEKALAYTRRWLELEPWQEKAHRQQMWLHWQLGNFDDALAQYERCATRLEHDLGIEPSPQTHELYELILKDQSSYQWQDVHEHAHSETAAAPTPENTPNTTTSNTASNTANPTTNRV
jgi:DNA-binding SARP family transcriptional activator